jgi:transposase-like protein
VDTALLWGLVEYGEKQRQRGVVIGAEVDGTRIGRVRMRLVRNTRVPYEHAFVEECVAPGSTIRTDDREGGKVWAQQGYVHEDGRGRSHSLEDRSNGTAFANMPRVDFVARRLTRWLRRTHADAVSQAQLRYYLDEFTFRFNARRCKEPGELFERLMRQAVTTAPVPYRAVVARVRSRR